MYKNDSVFNMCHSDGSDVTVLNLDSMYHLRPSLYNDGLSTINYVIGVNDMDVDIFDSIFMSCVTSLFIKQLPLDTHFIDMVMEIVNFETNIVIFIKEHMYDILLSYLNVFKNTVLSIFKDYIEMSELLDVTFTFMDNKSLAHAMIVRR